MAITFSASSRVQVPIDILVQKMTDPDEQEAIALHLGALAATATRTDLAGDMVHIELYTEEPSKQGGDAEKSTILMDWDVAARVCRWSRKDHRYGDRVKAVGKMTLSASGDDACTMTEEGTIEIGIPILGKKIAKKIAAAMERKQPKKARYWEQRINS